MNGKIFELVTDKDNIGYINEEYIPDWFLNYSDYWEDIDNPTNCIDNLLNMMSNYGAECNREENSFTFNIDVVRAYFENKYNEWRDHLAEALNDVTFEDFIGNKPCGIARSTMYDIKHSFADTSAYWVYVDDVLICLDTFMREWNKDKTYYIGNVINYHY